MERTCKKCGETKPLEEFAKARKCLHGRSHQCKSCVYAQQQVWKKTHRERVREQNRRARQLRCATAGVALAATNGASRARALGAPVIDHVIPLVVLERDDGVCGICDRDVDPFKFEIDHIIAFADGGEHSYENVQLAHPECNKRKQARQKKARKAAATP